jgi:hypothetical protein
VFSNSLIDKYAMSIRSSWGSFRISATSASLMWLAYHSTILRANVAISGHETGGASPL